MAESRLNPEPEESVSSDVSSLHVDTQQPLVGLETGGDVKSAEAIRTTAEPQPSISLEPTGAVKTANLKVEVAVQRPKRRMIRPRIGTPHVLGKVHTFDSFQYRDYRFLWGMTFFSSAAFWLQQVILGWLTYELTQSALLTSIAMGLDEAKGWLK